MTAAKPAADAAPDSAPLPVDAGAQVQDGQLQVVQSSTFAIHPKVASGMLGTWVAIIVLWAVHTYLNVTPPGEVDAAFAGLISFLVGYVVPSN